MSLEKLIQISSQIIESALTTGKTLSFSELSHEILKVENCRVDLVQNVDSLKSWFSNINDLEFLKESDKNNIEELIIDSPGLAKAVYSDRVDLINLGLDLSTLQLSLDYFTTLHDQKWNLSNPFISFNCTWNTNNWRASILHHTTGPKNKSKLFLRRIRNSKEKSLPMSQSIIDEINSKNNILVCGRTGSGKTTLLKAMLEFIPREDHIIVIEDTHELALKRDHVTNLVSDDSNKNILEMLTWTLRIRPDRLVLGELRSFEVPPFLLSANSGHRGCMTTIHSHSAEEALHRCALLLQVYSDGLSLSYNQALELVTKAFDTVIHVENKKVTQIINVKGSQNGKVFFEPKDLNNERREGIM